MGKAFINEKVSAYWKNSEEMYFQGMSLLVFLFLIKNIYVRKFFFDLVKNNKKPLGKET